MITIPPDFVDRDYADNQSYDVDLAHLCQGNWRAFRAIGLQLSEVQDIARGWRREFAGIDRPWLCWNVDSEWCIIQQRQVASVGWTPVVGYDPRVGPPRQVHSSAIVIDFNRELGLPILYPHFPLEFAYLFCEKMAFWHSDLLVRTQHLAEIAAVFERLKDGQTAATSGWSGWRRAFSTNKKRHFELIGCTTAGASKDQFEKGCGWWMDYWAHPNQPLGRSMRDRYYWDHGAGIWYWHKRQHGDCLVLSERRLREGHFTKIRRPDFQRYRERDSGSDARRSMAADIQVTFDLGQACASLGLSNFLQQADGEVLVEGPAGGSPSPA